MTNTNQLERRRVPRYPVRVPVTVVACDATVTAVRGQTVDICLDGLRIVTDGDLRHGVDQTILLEVAGGLIVTRAEIVRSERRGGQWVHGVLLTDIEPDDRIRLNQLCVDLV